MRQRSDNPQEWLLDRIEREKDNLVELYSLATTIAALLDPDTIQDTFQREMEHDGYFTTPPVVISKDDRRPFWAGNEVT